MKKQAGIYYAATIYKNNKTVAKVTKRKKMTFWSFLVRSFSPDSTFKVYIKVNYGKDLVNEGYYKTMAEIKQAFQAFTEKKLIDYTRSSRW